MIRTPTEMYHTSPFTSAGSSSPKHFTPTRLQGGSITTDIKQSSLLWLLKWRFSTCFRALAHLSCSSFKYFRKTLGHS